MDFTVVKSNLEKLGYKVSCFETSQEACEYLENMITGTTVGIGGSVSVQEMGLYPRLCAKNRVYWHWQPEEGLNVNDMLAKAQNTDVYISSVNALAQTGEIINIDGTGNRLASTLYGHKKVVFVVGKNKLAENFEKALWRARNIASPLNARRLNKLTPCAKGEVKCHDCKSPQRICRSLNVLWESPNGSEYEVVLINRDLGY